MGMHEVAYAMRGVADFMVGSEEVEPGAGYPYDDVLTGLTATPTMNGSTLAKLIVDKYAASYVGGYRPQDVTSAAFDLSKIEATNEQLASVADALKTDSVGNRAAIRQTLDSPDILRFVQKEDADMVTVMSAMNGLNLGNASQTATQAFSTALTSATSVVINSSASGHLAAGKGIALFLPQGAPGNYGDDPLEGYKSRVSFLPMQPWISFVGGLSDDSAPPPTPGTDATDNFSVILDWRTPSTGPSPTWISTCTSSSRTATSERLRTEPSAEAVSFPETRTTPVSRRSRTPSRRSTRSALCRARALLRRSDRRGGLPHPAGVPERSPGWKPDAAPREADGPRPRPGADGQFEAAQ